MTVRSDTLAVAQHGAGTFVDYTVPAGTTTILKDVRVAGHSTIAGSVDVQLQRLSGAQPTILHVVLPAGGGVAIGALSSAFIVMEPGDKLVIVNAGSAVVVDAWYSGAELAGIAP